MLDELPDEWPALVASAGSEYFQPMIDVGSSPVHVPSTRLQAALAARTYPYAESGRWWSHTGWDEVVSFVHDVTEKAGSAGVTFEAQGRSMRSALAEAPDALIVCEHDSREWTITVAANTRSTARKWLNAIGALLPEPPPPPPPEPLPYNVIPVRFWMRNPNTGEAMSRRRDITVQPWDEIEANYSLGVRSELAKLARMSNPAGGKLALFHGSPGTGKSRLLLSLMSEWRDWCTASVVTDTDRFFGDPTYLNSLIFNMEGHRQWLLLVVEDADEYLAVGSREAKGQSIARLLNIADGIVGQGLNILTILTTNVAVDELNPAIVRPGRCLANVNVGAFPASEASQWLTDRGKPGVEFDNDVTLATLYQTLNA